MRNKVNNCTYNLGGWVLVRIVRATIGSFIAAIVINGGWGVFVENIGPLGGILAATLLVGTMWFLNHYIE